MHTLSNDEIAMVGGAISSSDIAGVLASAWVGTVAGAAGGSLVPGAGTVAGAAAGFIFGVATGIAWLYATAPTGISPVGAGGGKSTWGGPIHLINDV